MDKKFSVDLLNWFQKNKRELPFRQTKDPYKIWLSEVIFQQTRISQGIVYYKRFIERFPSVFKLAAAEQDEVMLLWQGLGYYSRARNLHIAAQTVVNEYKGVFPNNYNKLLTLKGVGEYTAAAISSICYKENVVAIDGNVNRVIARYFAENEPVNGTLGRKRIKQYANELIDQQNPGDFNQAIMELGALICMPKNPDCLCCPIQAGCTANLQGSQLKYPVKLKNITIRQRLFYFLIIEGGEYTYIQKRGKGDIWESLYQFPLYEVSKRIPKEELPMANFLKRNYKIVKVSKEIKHVLTHQKIHARFIHVVPIKEELLDGMVRVGWDDLTRYSMPRLLTKYLDETNM